MSSHLACRSKHIPALLCLPVLMLACPRACAGGEPTALQRIGADEWHSAGVRGQGLKIAVLDSGFREYRSELGKGLPAQVTARSFRLDGNLEAKNSRHGI